MLINNRKLMFRELVEDLNIACGSVQDIVVNGLGLRCVTEKLVPKDMYFEKETALTSPKTMISKIESHPTFIKRIVTGDETWVYEYETQSSYQPSEGELRISQDQKDHVVFHNNCAKFISLMNAW
ncbi:uncharacterized protein LOC113004859 [Solenopsis invicta]|uniref:uncharacterized protein LOC113004859 n=1 Tax=Solenopsis invicta TaxID=13686 RepID=UPI00193D0075|nr:uncharacterized protein LOC113004859 [Solenopsis invicta]